MLLRLRKKLREFRQVAQDRCGSGLRFQHRSILSSVTRFFVTARISRSDGSLSENVSERQIDLLLEERLDVGFLRGRFDQVPGLTMCALTREALVLAVHRSHHLASKHASPHPSCGPSRFISYPANAGVGIYRQILALCERAGFEPRVVQEALEPSVIMGLVAAGLGVAIVRHRFKA